MLKSRIFCIFYQANIKLSFLYFLLFQDFLGRYAGFSVFCAYCPKLQSSQCILQIRKFRVDILLLLHGGSTDRVHSIFCLLALLCPANHPSGLKGVGKTFLTVLKQIFCHQRKLWCHLIVPRALSSAFQKILTCQGHSQDKKEYERPFLLSSLKMRIHTIWVHPALKYLVGSLGNLSKDGRSRRN